MYKILPLNAISDAIYDYLPTGEYAVDKEETAPDAILVRSMDCREREWNSNLLAIARAGAGTNNIPISRCSEQGIAVFNTPGANANAVKELFLGCLFLAARNVLDGVNWASTLQEPDVGIKVEQGKKAFIGHELYGKTLGVIGLGAIGVMVANAAQAIGMHVIGYDPFISVEHAWVLSRAVERASSFEDMLSKCDYLTIHVPLMKETRGYVNEKVLSMLKSDAMLFNLARGELVDNDAVLKALEENRLAKYVTDFPSAELIGKKNVICVPHLGASTPESEENCARMAAKELDAYLRLGNTENSVNFPNCSMPPSGVMRVCALHRNATNMVGQITAVLAEFGLNITNMMNKSRDEFAYTLLDLDTNLPSAAFDMLSGIEGMMKVRALAH